LYDLKNLSFVSATNGKLLQNEIQAKNKKTSKAVGIAPGNFRLNYEPIEIKFKITS